MTDESVGKVARNTPENRLYAGEPDVEAEQPDHATQPEQWRAWFDNRVRCSRRLKHNGRCYQARAPHSTRCDWCQDIPDYVDEDEPQGGRAAYSGAPEGTNPRGKPPTPAPAPTTARRAARPLPDDVPASPTGENAHTRDPARSAPRRQGASIADPPQDLSVPRMSPAEFDALDSLEAQLDACLDGTAPTDVEYGLTPARVEHVMGYGVTNPPATPKRRGRSLDDVGPRKLRPDEYIGPTVQLSNKACPNRYTGRGYGKAPPCHQNEPCKCPQGTCWYDAQLARRAEVKLAIEPQAWLAIQRGEAVE